MRGGIPPPLMRQCRFATAFDTKPMLGDIFRFLIEIAFLLFGAALAARIWMYAARLHPFNPFAQAVHQATNWLITPLRKIVPQHGAIDIASLLAIWLTALIYLLLMWVLSTGSLPPAPLLPTALGVAVLTAAKWGLNLIVWITLAQAILSWVNPLSPIMPVLQTLTAPLLAPIRRIMPNLGGLDLSPLALLILAQVAMMVLNRVGYSLFGV